MRLFCKQQEQDCHCKDKVGSHTVKSLNYVKRESVEKLLNEGEILILLSGEARLFIGAAPPIYLKEGDIIFLSPGNIYKVEFDKDTNLLSFSIGEQILRDKSLLYNVVNSNEEILDTPYSTPLRIKEPMQDYIRCLLTYLDSKINCPKVFELKIKELLLLMKLCYFKQELTALFAPILSSNTSFTYFILKNYSRIKTVKEFAQKANLSLSGFEKEFRKAFNSSPYKWMKEKRTDHLVREIRQSSKSMKEISEECGFTSSSQMNDFCKKEFGMPPGKLRSYFLKNGNY
ncbi:AraC-like DNA-binding protein [Parabacteroides sp. PF5-5]|uniref:helix-turn-helix domain-containing protein n=1 Tax=unclassified Parabacteroides TaxID=2649774 RepID=UPI0024744CA2|nr:MULTISPECIES: AraC family transcriptional regulator [unclassified Parabacteroides]MDH6306897.1 AraC-like DNA-binding protein [Parabacteroides sp. PH5-39]MDH6317715.1 AraC-like DNA-binding protein [Parabacteroides sp. PF5-13]MDH6321740.1 AraC-like DNA-binding protein [Parabacteroides sp. PH5-13]MDH6325284.1 AraC-like DNA-binding protein [Parabacteroides sp. PH5-8]MDH6328900.1 AraC-like DNA-binding protein [Parabacteroides sp. PH5-41]